MTIADHNRDQSAFYASLGEANDRAAALHPWHGGPVCDPEDAHPPLEDDQTPETDVIYEHDDIYRVTPDGVGWYYYDTYEEAWENHS